jgi:hypothetical protein
METKVAAAAGTARGRDHRQISGSDGNGLES